MGLDRLDRHDRRALGPHEVAIVVDPAPIVVGVELADEQDPRVVAMLAPVAQERLERPLLADGQVGAVGVGVADAIRPTAAAGSEIALRR